MSAGTMSPASQEYRTPTSQARREREDGAGGRERLLSNQKDEGENEMKMQAWVPLGIAISLFGSGCSSEMVRDLLSAQLAAVKAQQEQQAQQQSVHGSPATKQATRTNADSTQRSAANHYPNPDHNPDPDHYPNPDHNPDPDGGYPNPDGAYPDPDHKPVNTTAQPTSTAGTIKQ